MRNRTVGLLVLVLMVLACTTNSFARRGGTKFEWDEVTDKDWAVCEDSAGGIHDAVVIFEKVTQNDENLQHEKCYRTEYYRIRILSEKGREWADVDLPLKTEGLDIKFIKGRSIQRDGTVVELQSDNIFTKDVVKVEGAKFTQVMFSMPGVTNDCIIEYVINYQMEGAFLGWSSTEGTDLGWIAQKDIAVKHGEYHWIPAKFELDQRVIDFYDKFGAALDFKTPNYLWMNFLSAPRITKLPSPELAEEVVFEADDIPPFRGEPFSDPEASLRARVITYHGSDARSITYWGEFASFYAGFVGWFCKEDDRVEEVARQFEDMPKSWEKVTAAYKWLQDNITNLNYSDLVEINDKGEKKYREPKKIECANDVIKYGYGRRDDINIVFVDMLYHMDVLGMLCLARDRTQDLFMESLKYPQFDNSLVAVGMKAGSYRFYSPGHAMNPPGAVPQPLEGVRILICGSDDYFATTSFSASDDNTTITSCNYVFDDDLRVKGKMDCRMTGHDARNLRLAVVNKEEKNYAQLLQDELGELAPNAKLDSLSWTHLSDLESPLGLACVARYSRLDETANRVMLKPCDYLLQFDNPFFTDQRRYSIWLPYAHERRESAQFEIPEGWTVEAMPRDSLFKSPVGSCGILFTTFGNTVTVQRTFILNSPFWQAKNYSAVRDLFQTAADLDNLVVILARNTDTGTRGSVAPGE